MFCDRNYIESASVGQACDPPGRVLQIFLLQAIGMPTSEQCYCRAGACRTLLHRPTIHRGRPTRSCGPRQLRVCTHGRLQPKHHDHAVCGQSSQGNTIHRSGSTTRADRRRRSGGCGSAYRDTIRIPGRSCAGSLSSTARTVRPDRTMSSAMTTDRPSIPPGSARQRHSTLGSLLEKGSSVSVLRTNATPTSGTLK
jgi:hypothetical protein